MAYKKSGVCFCRYCAASGSGFRKHMKVNVKRVRRALDKVILLESLGDYTVEVK